MVQIIHVKDKKCNDVHVYNHLKDGDTLFLGQKKVKVVVKEVKCNSEGDIGRVSLVVYK